MTSKDVPPMLVNVNSRPMLSDICKLFEASGERFKALSGGSLPFDVKVPRADAEHFNSADFDSDEALAAAISRGKRLRDVNEISFALVEVQAEQGGRLMEFQEQLLSFDPLAVPASSGTGENKPPKLSVFFITDAASAVDAIRRIAGGLSKERRERVRKHFEAQASWAGSRESACATLRRIPGVSPSLQPELVLDVFGSIASLADVGVQQLLDELPIDRPDAEAIATFFQSGGA